MERTGIPHVKSSDGVDDASMSPDRPLAYTARAKSNGTRLGSPPLPQKRREEVLGLRSEGKSIRQIAAETGLSRGSVHNIVG